MGKVWLQTSGWLTENLSNRTKKGNKMDKWKLTEPYGRVPQEKTVSPEVPSEKISKQNFSKCIVKQS